MFYEKGYQVVFALYPDKELYGIKQNDGDKIIYTDIPFSEASAYDENGNEQEEFYTFKNYSEEEWLINLLNTGATKECMLWKEKNVTNILGGLSSEYE